MSKHTKGPWEALTSIVIGPDSETIAECKLDLDITLEERSANVHLISAAPEMFEALQRSLQTINEAYERLGVLGLRSSTPDPTEEIKQALDKAKGTKYGA